MASPWRPFRDVDAPVARLRLILLLATLSGLLLSAPLWTNDRFFPVLPIAGWFPVLPGPWDRILFCGALASLLLALRWYRPAVVCFLAAALVLYLGDQNRGQPWLYMYWVMLLLTLFPEPVALNACRIALAAIYLWSGLQKLHPKFFGAVVPWFVSPAQSWGLPSVVQTLLQWAVATAPIAEVVIGVGVWIPRLRRPALCVAAAVHAAALLFLGPLGHNVNLVVWPWNLAMLALLFVLFAGEPPPRIGPAFATLRSSRIAAGVAAAFCLLPILGFAGWWDKYFSFALYSGNQATADIFLAEGVSARLPERMQPFARAVRQEFNPEIQGPVLFDYTNWAMKELGTPPLIEPRGFRAVYHFVRRYATNDSDVRMLMLSGRDSILFFQGDQVAVLHAPGQ